MKIPYLLSLTTWLPALGAILILALFRNTQTRAIKRFATAWFGLAFLVSLGLTGYDRAAGGMQFLEDAPWIPIIGARYQMGVDGVAALLIMLTTLLGVIAALSSWDYIEKREKEYYVLLLLLQTAVVGVFSAMDLFLFYLFFEVSLVPMYFLIGIWGSDRRLYSAIKFFLYTLVGSVIMLLGILALYFYNHSVTGVYTFDVTQFAKLAVPFNLQWWLFLAFFFGFAIKVPMFPFHTWLPDAHTDAPTAGSVILAAVLLK
ncbi:MAG TPA: NADH-quinone oxidoreductase subunit M, partial [Pyrinomonadaceae bacterium]